MYKISLVLHNNIMKKKLYLFITFIIIGLLTFSFFNVLHVNKIDINRPNYIELYDNNNNLFYSYNNDYQGEYVELKDVSSCFIKTLINTEDKNFYNHHGFDYLRIIKSLFENIKSNSLNQGASTITQQLAKNLFLNNKKTILRKIKEAQITKKLESAYSKDYILELYINTVYFAHNIYGLKSASEFYFHKEPSLLNYQESCLLVGIINAPNLYSPLIDLNASNNKQKTIAYNLYKNNIININEYYDIIFNKSIIYGSSKKENNVEKYYHQAIFKELKNLNINSSLNGLKIETYFNKEIESLINNVLNKYELIDQVSVIVMKPYSNEVLALVGGKNYYKSQYNRALESYRQIGSTIKPFIYYLALEKGLTPLSKFTSEPTKFTLENGLTYSPNNANNIYAYRKINMVEALAMSDNIYAVKATLLVGSSNIKKLLNRLGANIENETLAISLGGCELTPLQLISAYNTLASTGKYYKPSFIKKVSLFNDTILYEDKKISKSVLNYDTTLIINHLLKAPFDQGLKTYSSPTMLPYQLNKTFACKTGSTPSSSWVVGFNKDYTLLVYVGDDNNKTLHDGRVSKKIFKDIVFSLTLDKEDNFYTYPNNLKPFKIHNGINNIYSFTYLTQKY